MHDDGDRDDGGVRDPSMIVTFCVQSTTRHIILKVKLVWVDWRLKE